MPKALESPVGSVTLAPGASVEAVITDDRSGPTASNVITIAIPNMNVQQTYLIPLGTRRFSTKLHDGKLSLKFDAADNYRTISPGGAYEVDKISPDATQITLYFESTKDADILEIETWI